MTTAIEETKREMYRHLESCKATIERGFSPRFSIRELERTLEAHLEELRKDLSFACAALDVEAARRAKMVQERDDIQGRLHAIDHAYFVQSQANAAAGEELRAAKAKIVDQREAICDLYIDKVMRKALPATMTLDEVENVAKEATGSLVASYQQENKTTCTCLYCRAAEKI